MKKNGIKRLLYAFLIILIILIAIDLKAWEYLEKKEIKEINLEDRCSVLFNNIIHSIKDESGCENYCKSECFSRDSKYFNSEFSINPEGCNGCLCYCK